MSEGVHVQQAVYVGPGWFSNDLSLFICPGMSQSPLAGEKQPGGCLKKEGRIEILRKMTQVRVGQGEGRVVRESMDV